MIARLRARVFYGWFMVAAGFGIQFLTGGLLNQAYGAYVVLLRDDFGWSKTSLSAAFSLARFESGLLGPIEGWLIDRFGPRTVMRFGLLIFAGGFMLFSQINSLTTFYLAFVVMALGSSLAGFLPLTVAVVNWFRRRRATALAVMQTGFAVGGLTVPLVVVALETIGWRGTAFASGVLVLAIGLPLSQIIRHRPEDYGLTVDGFTEAPSSNGDRPAQRDEIEPIDFKPNEAVRTPAFWLISLGHGSALLVVSAVMVHLVAHLNENLGYSLGTAALVVTLMTAMQIMGQPSGGVLGDRFSKRLIAAVCMARIWSACCSSPTPRCCLW
jgi:sugar phosphate permease